MTHSTQGDSLDSFACFCLLVSPKTFGIAYADQPVPQLVGHRTFGHVAVTGPSRPKVLAGHAIRIQVAPSFPQVLCAGALAAFLVHCRSLALPSSRGKDLSVC